MKNHNQNNNFEGKFSSTDFDKFPVFDENSAEKFQSLTESQPDILIGIMQSFIEESKMLLDNIEDAIQNSQMDKFCENIHTFKGLLGTIGALRLFEILKCIDQENKEGNFNIASEYFTLLKSNYDELEEVIKTKFLQ